MNINKLMSWLNLAAIFWTFICGVYLETLPKEYKSYLSWWAAAIFFAGPFVINYMLLPKVPIPKRKMTDISLVLLFLLVILDFFFLVSICGDQFNTSRGFALVGCVIGYAFVFLPIWITFLILVRIIKKGVSQSKV